MAKTRKKEKRALVERARKFCNGLRRHATRAELILRSAMDSKGWRYEFQSVQLKHAQKRFYIADFAMRTKTCERLLIEVDGSAHDGREAYDAHRTGWLQRQKGATVVRFTNAQVYDDLPTVLAAIEAYGPHVTNCRAEQVKQPPWWPHACKGCKVTPTVTRIVTYANGAQHRRWWCDGCQRLVGGNPVPRDIAQDILEMAVGGLTRLGVTEPVVASPVRT